MSRRSDDIDEFKQHHDDVVVVELGNGVTGLVLPAEPLPGDWSKQTTELVWLVPQGYPAQGCDCFWMDADATSPSAQPVVNTQVQPCPLGSGKTRRWVSWHMQWDPLRHNIEVWLNSMRQGIRSATGKVR